MAASKFDRIISDVLRREGGFIDDPADEGGRTQLGISEMAHPSAWADGKVTPEEAREIYFKKYVQWPKYDLIPDSHAVVQAQLIDFGVNSGPFVATQKLQGILGVKADGMLGPKTLAALTARDPKDVNNRLVAERLRMLARIVTKNPSQVKFIAGWVNRSLEFLF